MSVMTFLMSLYLLRDICEGCRCFRWKRKSNQDTPRTHVGPICIYLLTGSSGEDPDSYLNLSKSGVKITTIKSGACAQAKTVFLCGVIAKANCMLFGTHDALSERVPAPSPFDFGEPLKSCLFWFCAQSRLESMRH